MGSQMAAAYVGIMVFPPLYGIMAENISAGVFPLYLAIFLVAMIFALVTLIKTLKRERNDI